MARRRWNVQLEDGRKVCLPGSLDGTIEVGSRGHGA